MTDPELIPEDHYLRGRMGDDEGRLDLARRGLPDEEPEDDATADDILERLVGDEEDADDVEDGGNDGGKEPEEPRVGVVVASARQALRMWAAWHRRVSAGPPRVLPRGFALERPPSPTGEPVAFRVAALVEATPGFLLVERRLRAAAGLSPARDALPEVPRLPTALALLALPTFTALLEVALPVELFPPRVIGAKDLLPEERASLDAIEAKYRDRYPATWRRE